MHAEFRTLPAALPAAVRSDPNGPLLTYYDEATGERTELSATTLDNWVSKTANLLVDGSGLSAGEPVAVLLPAHWQTAAVLLGTLAAGTAVYTGDSGQVEVAFSTADRLTAARALRPAETYLMALAPMAAPAREVPPGTTDYVVEVRAYGDRFVPVEPVTGETAALLAPEPVSHAELAERATRYASDAGLAPGARLLVPVDAEPDPTTWLYAPLLAGASVVLCRNASAARLDAIADAERVTVRV